MRPIKISEFSDHVPRPERRAPAPITNLPVNAITTEMDPTLEIRTLIEQLQQVARDARAKTREAEVERDEIGTQLERSLIQIDELRANERELRAHFTEITTIIRERDAAIDTADRNARAAARAHEEISAVLKQRDETQRQRDEAFQQRDEMQQRLDQLTRAYSETGARSTEVQKQMGTIRQARDSAHAQIVELSSRASGLEDQIAELEYQREAAKKAQKKAEAEAAEYRRQGELETSQHEAAARRVEELTLELDDQRKKFLDLAETKAAALQAGNEHAEALAEVRAQVASITQERDAVRLLAQTQTRELENIRTQFLNFRENDAKAATDELAASRERLAALETEIRESRHEGQNLRQQLLAMQEKVTTLEVLAEDATARQEEAEVQLLGSSQRVEGDRLALQQARQQVEEITQERNSIRAKAEETRLELEAQLVGAASAGAPARGSEERRQPMESPIRGKCRSVLKEQRLQSIDLAARLEDAQKQIREMSASLAEARLQVKFAGANVPRKWRRRMSSWFKRIRSDGSATCCPPMRQSFEPLSKSPEEPSLLVESSQQRRGLCGARTVRELRCRAPSRARLRRSPRGAGRDSRSGQRLDPAHHRADHRIPGRSLSNDPAPERFKEPSQARVLCRRRRRGKLPVRATGHAGADASKPPARKTPPAALLELAGENFDLIFLDVNMPHLDGFELCERLRGMSHHAKTPVVFLTGLATAEKRAQALHERRQRFRGQAIQSPRTTVKAMTLILQAQVETA